MLKVLDTMKLSEQQLETQAEEALRACLEGVPFLEIQEIAREDARSDIAADLLGTVSSPAGIRRLIIEVKSNGQPRLARQAVNQIFRYIQSCPQAYGIFIAPYVSPRAAEICVQEGVGFLDLSGNCRLCFDGIYIEREGRPNKFAQRRGLRSLYKPKATRVLRVLLNNPKRMWKVIDLAEEAQVSLGLASNVKRELADREWICTEADGFSLTVPEALLAEWSDNYSFRQNRVKDYYSMKPIFEIEEALAEYCENRGFRYALTSLSGAARLAPSVRYQRAFAYVEGSLDDIALQLSLKEVTSGANVSLFTPYDEGVFYGTADFEGIQIASPPQVYLDLISFRGRGEEAANTLLEEVIKLQW